MDVRRASMADVVGVQTKLIVELKIETNNMYCENASQRLRIGVELTQAATPNRSGTLSAG